MSLEAKIDALTAAINRLAAATEGNSGVITQHERTAAVLVAEKAAAPAQTPDKEPAKTSAKALTYDDVKLPFLALVKKNRDAALAVLKPFGLDSLKPAKPEQFAAILAALNSALAA